MPRRELTINGRTYGWPERPTVVVCLDGSAVDYIESAIHAGVAPYLESLVTSDQCRMADAALPSFTNPNNVSIVTGVPPAAHGIAGNFFLDRATGEAVMMNDASFLRVETIPAAFSRAGARVAIVTAKDKLRRLLAHSLDGDCISIESKGVEVYSAALSEETLAEGVRLLASDRPDLLYLSTSDYVQHKHPPGDDAAIRFYGAVDRSLAAIDRVGATLVVTADHGMRAKADTAGRVRAVFLQEILDQWVGAHTARVILPITDPYVLHHGSLGSCAMIYLPESAQAPAATPGSPARQPRWGGAPGGAPSRAHGKSRRGVSVSSRRGWRPAASAEMLAEHVAAITGIDIALPRDRACHTFELPPDRTGDIVVFADADTVIGTRPADHDLSALDAPLRSHGGRAEQQVPFLANRPIVTAAEHRLRNFDAFAVALAAS